MFSLPSRFSPFLLILSSRVSQPFLPRYLSSPTFPPGFPSPAILELTRRGRSRLKFGPLFGSRSSVPRYGCGVSRVWKNIGSSPVSLRMKTPQTLEPARMELSLARQFACEKSPLAQFSRLLRSAGVIPYTSAVIGTLQDVQELEMPRRAAAEMVGAARRWARKSFVARCFAALGDGGFIAPIFVRGESSFRWLGLPSSENCLLKTWTPRATQFACSVSAVSSLLPGVWFRLRAAFLTWPTPS